MIRAVIIDDIPEAITVLKSDLEKLLRRNRSCW